VVADSGRQFSRFNAAAAIHFGLGLWALYQRRHFRYTVVEITSARLRLSIPLLLASHFGIVRLGGLMFGRRPADLCRAPVGLLGPRVPYMVAVQFLLLTVPGRMPASEFYFWLAPEKPFFKWAPPLLFAIAVLMPPLAMTGTHRGATRRSNGGAARNGAFSEHISRPRRRSARRIEEITLFYFVSMSPHLCWYSWRAARPRRARSRRGSITVSVSRPGVRVAQGPEHPGKPACVSTAHASVCGGRARCSDLRCAWSVTAARCGGPPAARHSCWRGRRQWQPVDPARMPASAAKRYRRDSGAACPMSAPIFVRNRHRVNIVCEERHVVSMFIDMRGSTKMAKPVAVRRRIPDQ